VRIRSVDVSDGPLADGKTLNYASFATNADRSLILE